MPFCLSESDIDLSVHEIISGPWEDACADCDFLTAPRPCLPCRGSSRSSEIPCCPEGANTLGDVHHVWDGYIPSGIGPGAASILNSTVVFDDNHIVNGLKSGESVSIDHYAVAWVEVHNDDSVHAIIAERKVTCMWPKATITTNHVVVGEPRAATLDVFGGGAIQTPANCTECIVSGETMVSSLVRVDPEELENIKSYGGLHWEAMKYLADLNLTNKGHSLVGDFVTFSSAFRLQTSSPGPEQLKSSGPMHSGYPYDVYEKLTQHALNVEMWKREGSLDLSEQIAFRNERWARPRERKPGESRCCAASDLEFLNPLGCDECAGGGGCCYCSIGVSWDCGSLDLCKAAGGSLVEGDPTCGCIFINEIACGSGCEGFMFGGGTEAPGNCCDRKCSLGSCS